MKAGGADLRDKLKTLADAFPTNAKAVSLQFFNVREIAQATLLANNRNDREAWRSSALRCIAGK